MILLPGMLRVGYWSLGKRKVVLHHWALHTCLSKIKTKVLVSFVLVLLFLVRSRALPNFLFQVPGLACQHKVLLNLLWRWLVHRCLSCIKKPSRIQLFNDRFVALKPCSAYVNAHVGNLPVVFRKMPMVTVLLHLVLKAVALRLESVVSILEVWRLSRRLRESNGNPGFLEVIASDFSKFCAGTSASGGAMTAHAIAGKSQRIIGLPEDMEFHSSKHLVQNPASLHASAGENEEITGLLEVRESDCMRAGAAVATAGEREGIVGFRGSDSSLRMPINSLNSSGSVDVDACARDLALLLAPASLSSPASAPASLAVVAHVRSTPTHVAHNSWSDTGRNSRCTGGLLPVWVGRQGPTRRKGTKGGGFPVRPKICALSQRWRQG